MPKDTSNARRDNTRTSPPKNRKPAHCNKCTGRPLRSECMHTQAGRASIELHAEHAEETPRSSPLCTLCEGRPLRSQCVHTRTGRIYVQEQQILNELQPASEPNGFTANDIPIDRISGDPLNDPRDTPGDQPSGSLQDLNQRPPVQVPFLPQSTDCDASALSASPQASDSHENGVTPPSLLVSQQSEDPSTSKVDKPDYARATKANPKHGFVQGMRGADRHDIVRKHARPERIQDGKIASKRFLENMNRLIEKSDDLAASTDCWVFIGAQHGSGVGGTLHYTSPRLLCDAGEQMNGIVNDFHGLMTNLLQARRADALELSQKLKQVEIEKEEAEKQVNGLRDRILNQEKLLQMYATRLGIGADELEVTAN